MSAPRMTAAEPAAIISQLINPAKLATLRVRGANPRVQKCVYWLSTARAANQDPTKILETALARAGYANAPAARLTRDALLRNLDIATKLGCLDADGLAEMRHGKAPTIHKGPYRGDQLSVDHIIPRAVCTELDNVIANLELMPLRMNESKNAKVGERQLSLAKKFRAAGLLTPADWKKSKSPPCDLPAKTHRIRVVSLRSRSNRHRNPGVKIRRFVNQPPLNSPVEEIISGIKSKSSSCAGPVARRFATGFG